MMTNAGFRKLALSLPGAQERVHMRHPDFRMVSEIFATPGYPRRGWAMIKLTRDAQAAFVARRPAAFVPVKGKWGERGCTNVILVEATIPPVRAALRVEAAVKLVRRGSVRVARLHPRGADYA